MTTVAIIGAGPLGRWLALAAANAGYRVLLEDVLPANLHHAREYLRRQLGPETMGIPVAADGHGNPSPERAKVEFVSSIEDAVRDADLAIDCVPDELESKLEILWLLDRMAPPRTVLATPTTRLSIADLAACTYRHEKCVAIASDAREMPQSLEAVPGEPGVPAKTEILLRGTPATAPATVELLTEFWHRLGFMPRFEEVKS